MMVNYRTPFAPEFNFVVKHPFTFKGREYTQGEDFDKADADQRLLFQLWDAHKLDAVIPSIIIQDGASRIAAPKEKLKKAKIEEPVAEPVSEPAKAEKRYRLDNNFGVLKIMDGDKVLRQCTNFDEAKSAIAEISGE